MAKNKQHRALFEVLLKSHVQEPPKVTVQAKPQLGTPPAAPPTPGAARPAAPSPKPVTEAARPSAPAVGPARPAAAAAPVGRSAEQIFASGRLVMTYYQLLACAVAVLVLCVVAFVLGMHFGGGPDLPLPRTPSSPTIPDVQKRAVTPGLVKPGPEDTAVGGAEHPGEEPLAHLPPGKGQPIPVGAPEKPEKAAPPAKVAPGKAAGAGTEEAGDPNGKLRLRLAQLKNTDSTKTDRLREFLAENGVETHLVARGGFQFVYSQAKFASDTEPKAKAYKDNVVRLLKEFKKQTGITVSTDAFYVAAD